LRTWLLGTATLVLLYPLEARKVRNTIKEVRS